MSDLHTIPALPEAADHFRLIREEAERLAAGLSDAQFNWKPAADRWSIGQCLEHLNVLGYLLLPRLEDAVSREQGREGGRTKAANPGFFGRIFIKFNAPVVKRRVTTPTPYSPTGSDLDRADVTRRFDALQERLIRLAEQAAGMDLNHVKVTSPALRILRLNVPAWIITTAAHEQRHLLQAQRVRAEPGFPSV